MTNEAAIAPAAPSERLYSASQIAWATLIGSPLAGCLLLGLNYRTVGKPRAAWQSLIGGFGSLVVLLSIGLVLPERFPSMVFPVASSLAMRQLAKRLQGDTINGHLASGGKRASWWLTIGISVAILFVIVVVVFGGIFLFG